MIFRNRKVYTGIGAVLLLAVFLPGNCFPVTASGTSDTVDPLASIPCDDWTYSALRGLYQSGLLSDWERALPPGETLMRFEVALLTQEALLRWQGTDRTLSPDLERLVKTYFPELELLGWKATMNSLGAVEAVRFQDLNTIIAASAPGNSLVMGGLNLDRQLDGTGQGNYRLVVGSAVADGPIMVNAIRTQQLLLVGGNLPSPVSVLKPDGPSTTSLEGEISLGENLRVVGGTSYSSGPSLEKNITSQQQLGALVVFPGVEVGAEVRTKAGGQFMALDPVDSVGGGVSVKIGKITLQTGLDLLHPSDTYQAAPESGFVNPSPEGSSQEPGGTNSQWNGSQASAGIKVEINENSVLQANISLGRERSGEQEKSVTSFGIGYQMDSAIFLLGYSLLNFGDVNQETEHHATAELKVEF